MELITASALRWRMEGYYSLEEFIRACFQEIQGMTDGSPVYPVEWDYFDDEELEGRNDYPLLIDPANPANNLLECLTADDFSRIRRYASRAITLLDREDYGLVFDPRNKTGRFVVAS
jgi:hypothetical protein